MKLVKNYISVLSLLFVFLPLLHGCGGGGDAAHIQIGTGNTVTAFTATQYRKSMSVQVTDIEGIPVPNARVSVRIDPVSYHKGGYIYVDEDGVASTLADAARWAASVAVTCTAEDANLNAVLDAAEDINGNGVLDPSNVATITEDPVFLPTIDLLTDIITTDESGFGYFTITYPKNVANWVDVRVTASVTVTGTESTNALDFTLGILLLDIEDVTITPPGGVSSLYGIANDCADPN